MFRQKDDQEASVKDPTKIIETSGGFYASNFPHNGAKKPPHFAADLGVYLFSEELINENNFDLVINQFIRDNETRRGSLVFMTSEKPGDMLKINDDGQPASSTLYDLSENRKTTIRMFKTVSLGDISSAMQNNVSFAVPKVSVDQGKLILDGASIIKNRRFLTNISPLAVQSYNLLTGVKRRRDCSKYDHSIYSFEIFKMKHHIKPINQPVEDTNLMSVTLDGRLSRRLE
ncbi:hypothetical protein ACEQPO_24710 [Bacillus sp. SL00103]